MNNILIVGSSNRKESLETFKNDRKGNYFLLDSNRADSTDVDDFFKIINHNEFWSPKKLLKKHNISIIIFYEVLDLIQISLCVYANFSGLKTFFLEHGITLGVKDYNLLYNAKKNRRLNKRKRYSKLLSKFFIVLKRRYFFFSSLFYIKKNKLQFMQLYYSIDIISDKYAVSNYQISEISPQSFLLFNEQNIEYRNHLYNFLDNQHKNYLTVGAPNILKYKKQIDNLNSEIILFIITPFWESKAMNWDQDFNQKFITKIIEICHVWKTKKFYVKLHPNSNIQEWKKHILPENLNILKERDKNIYESASLIIGYFSSLLIEFISNKRNVLTLGFHPKCSFIGNPLSELKIVHKTLSIEDLKRNLEIYINQNLCKNESLHKDFIKKYNPHFNSKLSTKERIINLIHA